MSKIALIALVADHVNGWYTASGMDEETAPWVRSHTMARIHAPFASVICLTGWDSNETNVQIKAIIESRYMEREVGGAEVSGVLIDEGSTPETGSFEPIGMSEGTADLSNPEMPERERALRRAGLSPTFIGVLPEDNRESVYRLLRAWQSGETDAQRFDRYVRDLGLAYNIAEPYGRPTVESEMDRWRDRCVTDIQVFRPNLSRDALLVLPRDRLGQLASLCRIGTMAAGQGDVSRVEHQNTVITNILRAIVLERSDTPEPTDAELGFEGTNEIIADAVQRREEWAARREARLVQNRPVRSPQIGDNLAGYMTELRRQNRR